MRVLRLEEDEYAKLRNLLNKGGDALRVLAEYKQGADAKAEAVELADGCDHWLEIIEGLADRL